MDKKMLQVYLDAATWNWIKKSQKEMKTPNLTEFMRTWFSYIMEIDSVEFKARVQKARITNALKEAEERAEKALKEKEALQEQYEALSA